VVLKMSITSRAFLSKGGLAWTVPVVDAEAVGGAEILLLQRSASASRAALAAQSVRAAHWSCHRAVRKSPLWDYASDLAVFGDTIDETVLVLIGSSSSLLGQGERIEAEHKDDSHSINYYIDSFIESSHKDEREWRKSHDYKTAMNAAIRAIDQLPEFTQTLEFLAKTLYTKEFKDRLLIVATPIYVALAE
jgi:hypothetical protein